MTSWNSWARNGDRLSRLRIAWLCQHYPLRSGGAEKLAERLSQQWRAEGHSVHLVSAVPNSLVGIADDDETRIPISPTRFLGTTQLLHRVPRWLAAEANRFDVVLVSMLKHLAWAALRQSRLPVVLRAEGGGPMGDMAWQSRALGGSFVRKSCQKARAIIAPTPVIERELRDAGFSKDRLHLIPNGVAIPTTPWNPADTPRWRARLGLPERSTAVFIGRLEPAKGVSFLFELARQRTQSCLSCSFVLLGDGPLRDGARQAADNGIIAPGYVANVEDYLRAADVLLLPSHSEGLSLALLEGLALGIPILASDIPGNRGIAPAHLIPRLPIDDPAAWLAALDKTLRETNIERIQHRRAIIHERYSLEACSQAHLDVLRQAAGG